MANISAHISDDCRFLSATFQGVTGPCTLAIFNNETQVFTQEADIPDTVGLGDQPSLPTSLTWAIDDVVGELDPEILTIQVTDWEGNTALAGVVNSCFLECCLAQKTMDLGGCQCGEPQCDKLLAEAQRLFLLIKSIRTFLLNMGSDPNIATGIRDRAIEAYTAAKNQCSSFCGCDC